MIKNTLLLLVTVCVTGLLTAQVPQFAYPAACEPGLFGSEPLFGGEVHLDGVPAEVGIDSIAVFDADDNVIISGVIQSVMSGGMTLSGFGFKLRPEDMSGCAGYSSMDPITLVFYDASAMDCKFNTAPNGTFVVTTTMSGSLNFVDGPDGDFSTVDLYNFSSATCVDALPVQFASFRASVNTNGSVALNWVTGEELNNSHFIVERSVSGEAWANIASVEGAGTTNRTSSYVFTDNNPYNGQNLYRIKQVDFDGAYSYSTIATVNVTGNKVPGIAQMFPNPLSGDQGTLSLSGQWDADANASLYDANGRVVARFNALQNGSTTIDLPELPAGVYQMVVTDQQNRQIIRLMVR